MTLKELKIFYYLADNPHLSQLSKKISLSQSAISLSIKSLEKKLSEPLFDRIGKKLILNERGRLFKKETHKHFLALKDAENFFKQDSLSGVIKIVSSKTIGNYILPQLLYNFSLKNPHALIDKNIQNSATIIKLVLDGDIDIGIIETECEDKNLVKEVLTEDTLIVVTSDNSMANKLYFIDQLFSKRWILREEGSGTRELFFNSLQELREKLKIFIEYTEFEEMKTLLLKNPETITCVSKYAVEKELQREELFEIAINNISLKRKLSIIYNKNKYKTTLFKSFLNFLKTNFGKL